MDTHTHMWQLSPGFCDLEQIFDPFGVSAYEITTFDNFDSEVTWPLKVKAPNFRLSLIL